MFSKCDLSKEEDQINALLSFVLNKISNLKMKFCTYYYFCFTTSKSIPHFGHFPGLSLFTSACIGQE